MLEFKTFTKEMIDEASGLLAHRHKRERKSFPTLPARFEEGVFSKKALEGLYDSAPVIGIAAFRGNKMAGYMIAKTLNEPQRGRHAWIDYPGYCLAVEEDKELIRILYANLGERLVELGYFSHFVLAPASDQTEIDAWLRVCFAYEQVQAFKDLSEVEEPAYVDPSIRLAAKSDEAEVREMSNKIGIQVSGPPVWGANLPETMPDLRDGYAELLDEEDIRYWAFFQEDGSIASCMATWPDPASESNMCIPEHCMTVSCVATRDEYRGKGLSSQLLAVALAEAGKRGFRVCETDWRIANIPISNFLPRRGFIPYAYRLHRQVDSRILWANGINSTASYS